MKPIQKQINGFDVIEITGEEGGPCVVLLHGYGADFRDLAPLSQVIEAPAGTTWIFPNGPMEVPIGPMMMGRAWFPIPIEEMNQAAMRGEHMTFERKDSPELQAVGRQMAGLFQEVLKRGHSQVFFGGFSQGSMVTCDAVFSHQIQNDGIILLSSTPIALERWQQSFSSFEKQRVIQSHGSSDPLLSFEDAKRLQSAFVDAGFESEWIEFAGGHEIPQNVIDGVSRFIND